MRITLVSRETGTKLTGNARPKLTSIRAELAMHQQRFRICSAWLAKNPKHRAYLEEEGLINELGVTEIPQPKFKSERVPVIAKDSKHPLPGAALLILC